MQRFNYQVGQIFVKKNTKNSLLEWAQKTKYLLNFSFGFNCFVISSNVFMRFILSLCVSDFISALISWLFLYRRTWGFDRWSPIPDVFCTVSFKIIIKISSNHKTFVRLHFCRLFTSGCCGIQRILTCGIQHTTNSIYSISVGYLLQGVAAYNEVVLTNKQPQKVARTKYILQIAIKIIN